MRRTCCIGLMRASGCALVLAASSGAVVGQVMALGLDGDLVGRCGDRKVTARLGPGAKFVPSAEGQGVEPGATGPAVVVPWRRVPSWTSRWASGRGTRS